MILFALLELRVGRQLCYADEAVGKQARKAPRKVLEPCSDEFKSLGSLFLPFYALTAVFLPNKHLCYKKGDVLGKVKLRANHCR